MGFSTVRLMQPSSQFLNVFITAKGSSITISHCPHPTTSLAPVQLPIYFLSLFIFLFWIFHLNRIIYYIIFGDLFLSLNVLRFFHVSCINTLFLFIDKTNTTFLGGWTLDYFYLLTIMNNIAINIWVQVFV